MERVNELRRFLDGMVVRECGLQADESRVVNGEGRDEVVD